MLWLEYQSFMRSIFVRHKGNGVEMRITVEMNKKKKVLMVDGYSYQTTPATVFEYITCGFAEGYCPECCRRKPPYQFFGNDKWNDELEREQAIRFNAIRNAGYELVVGYSCGWKNLKQTSPIAKAVSLDCQIGPKIRDNGMTEAELLDKIESGEMAGFLVASAVVPTNLRAYFADFPPLFKKVEFHRGNVSPVMQKYVEKHDMLKIPSINLLVVILSTT